MIILIAELKKRKLDLFLVSKTLKCYKTEFHLNAILLIQIKNKAKLIGGIQIILINFKLRGFDI